LRKSDISKLDPSSGEPVIGPSEYEGHHAMRFLASGHIPFMLLVFFVNNFLIGFSPFVKHEFVLLN
jgi:hypothetical protein